MTVSEAGVTEDNRRIAAFAAFGIAALPVYIFLPRIVGLAFGAPDNPSGLSRDAQVAVSAAYPYAYGSLGLANLIVGASFMVLALALHAHLRATAPFAARVATAVGAIGGALSLTAGFMPLTVAKGIVRIDAEYHAAALALFVTGQTVTGSLSTASSVLFGTFAFLASVSGARAGLLPRALPYLGAVIAIANVVNVLVPAAWPVTILTMLVWAAWLGVALLRGGRRGAAAQGATSTAGV